MRIFIATLIMATAAVAYAAVPFSNPLAKKMADAMALEVKADTLRPHSQYVATNFGGRTVKVTTDYAGRVASVGYDLFGNASMPGNANASILQFVERYMLQLDLKLGSRDARQQCMIDKVSLTPDVNLLSGIDRTTPFAITKQNRRHIKLVWRTQSMERSISFPADVQLIMGMNAPELEQYAMDAIINAPAATPKLHDLLKTGAMQCSGDMAILVGDEYLSSAIRNDLYFKVVENKQDTCLIYDASNPIRTISNILLTGISPFELPVRLTVDLYGHKTTTFTTTVSKLINFMSEDGCIPYFGVKKVDDNMLRGTLFALNADLGYNHVVSVDFPNSMLEGDTADMISARFYAYIPLHNVIEQFFYQDLSPYPDYDR